MVLSKKTTKKAKVVNNSRPKASKKPFKIAAPFRWIFNKVLRPAGGYFKGSWQELRQVYWPNRKATWSMTLAVILFSGFFFIMIVLLDDLFAWLFKQVIK
ncbi:preprotein translocase subunit SecE [Candidatus Saccharibacteria bacterium]|nr:preprotein translocase subunit SecE [Candidatus Saccharibacteria bacterium]